MAPELKAYAETLSADAVFCGIPYLPEQNPVRRFLTHNAHTAFVFAV
jgi:hypothetical protein